MKTDIELKVIGNIEMPEYQTEMSGAVDICAAIDEPIDLLPGQSSFFPSGIAIFINDPNLAGVVLPRSGLGSRGIVLANTIGLIDADYQGEIKVCLYNRSDRCFVVEPMMRIAQLMIIPIFRARFRRVNEFSGMTRRSDKGFGSTGL